MGATLAVLSFISFLLITKQFPTGHGQTAAVSREVQPHEAIAKSEQMAAPAKSRIKRLIHQFDNREILWPQSSRHLFVNDPVSRHYENPSTFLDIIMKSLITPELLGASQKYGKHAFDFRNAISIGEDDIKIRRNEDIIPTWPSRGKKSNLLNGNRTRREEDYELFWGNRGKKNDDSDVFWGNRGKKNTDNDPFWGNRGRRNGEDDHFWGNRGKKEDDSVFWGNRGKKSDDDPFWGNRGKKEMDDPFWGNRGKKNIDDPFWGNRGKKNDEEAFWGNRGKKDDDGAFWGNRGKKDDEEAFWGNRGKKDDDEAFWGNRGKKDDEEAFWGNRGKKDDHEAFWGNRGKKEDEEAFWGNRGKKDDEEAFWGNRGKRDDEEAFWGNRGKKGDVEAFWGNRGKKDDEGTFWGNRGKKNDEEAFWGNRGKKDDDEAFWGNRGKKDIDDPFWGNRGKRQRERLYNPNNGDLELYWKHGGKPRDNWNILKTQTSPPKPHVQYGIERFFHQYGSDPRREPLPIPEDKYGHIMNQVNRDEKLSALISELLEKEFKNSQSVNEEKNVRNKTSGSLVSRKGMIMKGKSDAHDIIIIQDGATQDESTRRKRNLSSHSNNVYLKDKQTDSPRRQETKNTSSTSTILTSIRKKRNTKPNDYENMDKASTESDVLVLSRPLDPSKNEEIVVVNSIAENNTRQ